MIIFCLLISVLGFAATNVFGTKMWHKLFTLIFGVIFIVSTCFIVLNDKDHFGMKKVVKDQKIELVSSADSKTGPSMLLYQPLGTSGEEKVYLYKTTDKDKLQKTGTDQVKNTVTKTADKASLTQKTTSWTYDKDWAKLLFGIADNDNQFDHQQNDFNLPKEWFVLSVDQAKNLGTYMKEHQADIQTQAKAYVTEKMTALLTANPTLSAAEQKQATEKFGQEFQQQLIQKIVDGTIK